MFFSKDMKSAVRRVKELAKTDKFYVGKVPVLAGKQVRHISKWKTYEVK